MNKQRITLLLLIFYLFTYCNTTASKFLINYENNEYLGSISVGKESDMELTLVSYLNSYIDLKRTFSGYICSLTLNKTLDNCKKTQKNIILLIESEDEAQSIYNIQGFYSLVISKENILNKDKIKQKSIPFFTISNDNYSKLLSYDISTQSNFMANVSYYGVTSLNMKLSILLNIFFLYAVAFNIFLLIWIIYNCFLMRKYKISTQKYYNHLPFLMTALLYGIYYKAKVMIEGNENSLNLSLLFSGLLTSLASIIYNTFYWILLYMISCSYTIFSFSQSRSFFLMFVMIYLIFLSDIILNNIVTVKQVGYFSFEYLKNCILFIVIMVISSVKSYRVLSQINKNHIKLLESIDNDRLMKCIIIKYNQIKNNMKILYLHTSLYIIGNLIICLYTQSSMTGLHLIFNSTVSSLGLIAILINLRSREIIHSFDNNDIAFILEENLVFKVNPSKKNQYQSTIDQIVEYKDKKMHPSDYVLIINPCFSYNSIEKTEIKERNKLTTTIGDDLFDTRLIEYKKHEDITLLMNSIMIGTHSYIK